MKYDKNFSISVFMTKIDNYKMQPQELKRDSKPKLNSKESKTKSAEQLQ